MTYRGEWNKSRIKPVHQIMEVDELELYKVGQNTQCTHRNRFSFVTKITMGDQVPVTIQIITYPKLINSRWYQRVSQS